MLHLLKIPEANKSGKYHHLRQLHASQGLHIREQTCVVRLVNGTCQINIVNYISLKKQNKKNKQTLRRQQAASFLVIGYILFYVQ